jgi:hypothetical protein
LEHNFLKPLRLLVFKASGVPREALPRNARETPHEFQLNGLKIVKGLHGRDEGNSLGEFVNS